MAATSWNPLNPRIVAKDGMPRILYSMSEKAGQTYKAGTPVFMDDFGTDDYVEICADGTHSFTGIAQVDASGTTATEAPVQVAGPDDYVYAYCTNAGTANDADDYLVGQLYSWYEDADDVFSADLATAGAGVLVFVESVKDVNGDSTYWGRFYHKQGAIGNVDTASV